MSDDGNSTNGKRTFGLAHVATTGSAVSLGLVLALWGLWGRPMELSIEQLRRDIKECSRRDETTTIEREMLAHHAQRGHSGVLEDVATLRQSLATIDAEIYALRANDVRLEEGLKAASVEFSRLYHETAALQERLARVESRCPKKGSVK